jgi:magnesium transporter
MSTLADNENAHKETILALLEDDNDARLARQAAAMHPADLAEVIESLEDEDAAARLFRVLTAEHAGEVLRDLSEQTRSLLHDRVSDARLAAIVEHLDTDDATDVVAELPAARQRTLLHRATPETRRDVEELLSYPEDTAGGIMKTEVAVCAVDSTVKEITEYIREHGEEFHDIHAVFVSDTDGKLAGYIPLRRLILASDFTLADQIMEPDVVSVSTDLDQEEVAHLFEKYDVVSVPVVDSDEHVVGRITIDDIVDVIEEEATEDMLRLAGIGDEPVTFSGPLAGIRSRLPWLALNLVTASVSVATIAMFEGTIQSIAIAAALMTIVASQGGNAGMQTLTLMVRGLALGEVEPRNALRILGREMLVALANGAALGAIAGGVVYVWRGDASLSVVLAGALVMNLLIAACLGSLVPIGLKLLGVDPAVSSSGLVTAGTDMLGFFIFHGLLTLFL